MKKQLFIISIILLFFVSCTKDEIKENNQKNDLSNVSLSEFDFDKFYNLVRNPVSIDLLKSKLDEQKITYQTPSEEDESKADIYFVTKAPANSVYPNYRIEVEVGTVLVNFDNPKKGDVKENYVKNIIIYPLDEEQNFITEKDDKYIEVFNLVKESLDNVSSYETSFKIYKNTFTVEDKPYEDFIKGAVNNSRIAVWYKDTKELTIENSSRENNVPRVEVNYKLNSLSLFGGGNGLPYESIYQIKINTNLPLDYKELLFK